MVMDKRGRVPEVPSPARVGVGALRMCDREVDTRIKRLARKPLNALKKMQLQLAEVGRGVQFGSGVKIPRGSRLGHFCYIGSGFDSPSPVSIGDLCMVSTSVKIVGNDHGVSNALLPTRLDFQWRHSVTTIGADVWIGHGVILRSGISIGTGSVIAAGAVVVKDVLPNSIVGGNPCRIIRRRFSDTDWSLYLATLGVDDAT